MEDRGKGGEEAAAPRANKNGASLQSTLQALLISEWTVASTVVMRDAAFVPAESNDDADPEELGKRGRVAGVSARETEILAFFSHAARARVGC